MMTTDPRLALVATLHGRALAIVRSRGTPGRVTVAATVPGLPSAQLVLEAVEGSPRK